MDSLIPILLDVCLSWWMLLFLSAVLPVMWSRRCSRNANRKTNTRKSRYEWSPSDGIYVAMRFGKGVRRKYKTTKVHTIKSAVFECFVPKNFEFDGASIPFWAMPLIYLLDPWAVYQRGAFVHDILCYFQPVSRFSADAIFYDIMYEDDVPFLARKALFYAVRIGGDKSWRRNTADRKDRERREKVYGPQE